MTRNSEVLDDFTKYCIAHPRERFWQALRNWSGLAFVLACENPDGEGAFDTFYWESRLERKEVDA